MSNRFSLYGGIIEEEGYFLEVVGKMKPAAQLIFSNGGLAERVQGMLPNSHIIHREWPPPLGKDEDGHEWYKMTPAQRLDVFPAMDKRILRYACNEPAVNPDKPEQTPEKHAAWMCGMMHTAYADGIRLVLGNWATGSVQEKWLQDGVYDAFLRELCTTYRGHHVLGVHEYAIGLIPWGTGSWDHRTLWEKDHVVPYGKWPNPADVPPLQPGDPFHYWFIMRLELFARRARELGLEPPEMIVTEWGWDHVWVNRKPIRIKDEIQDHHGASGFEEVRGVETLRDAWKALYPNASFNDMVYRQVVWMDTIYPAYVLGFIHFGWFMHGEWRHKHGVNLGGRIHHMLHNLLIAYANMTEPEPAPEPPAPEPPPPDPDPPVLPEDVAFPGNTDPGWAVVHIKSTGSFSNVRSFPSKAATVVGMVHEGMFALNKEQGWKDHHGFTWLPIQHPNGNGWIRSDTIFYPPPPPLDKEQHLRELLLAISAAIQTYLEDTG